jgi:hypothetical protein
MRAIRIVLLIANGVWLPIFAFGSASRAYYLFARINVEWPFDAAAWTVLLAVAIPPVVCSSILAGNIAYIWRSRPHAHNEKGTNASHAPAAHGA